MKSIDNHAMIAQIKIPKQKDGALLLCIGDAEFISHHNDGQPSLSEENFFKYLSNMH